jgi:hypothetical protein
MMNDSSEPHGTHGSDLDRKILAIHLLYWPPAETCRTVEVQAAEAVAGLLSRLDSVPSRRSLGREDAPEEAALTEFCEP